MVITLVKQGTANQDRAAACLRDFRARSASAAFTHTARTRAVRSVITIAGSPASKPHVAAVTAPASHTIRAGVHSRNKRRSPNPASHPNPARNATSQPGDRNPTYRPVKPGRKLIFCSPNVYSSRTVGVVTPGLPIFPAHTMLGTAISSDSGT